MLKNAHIWATGAALMRALVAVASVQHTPRVMRILFRGDTLKISSDSQWNCPLVRGGLRKSRAVPGGGQWEKSEPMSKPIEPVVV